MQISLVTAHTVDDFAKWLAAYTNEVSRLEFSILTEDTALLAEYDAIKSKKLVHSLDKTIYLLEPVGPNRSSRGYHWLRMDAKVGGIALPDEDRDRHIANLAKIGVFGETRHGDMRHQERPKVPKPKVDYSVPKPKTFSLGIAIWIRLFPMPDDKLTIKIESMYHTFDDYAKKLADGYRTYIEPPAPTNGADKAPTKGRDKKGAGGRPSRSLGKYTKARADEALRRRRIADKEGHKLTFEQIASGMQNNMAKYGPATWENVSYAYNKMVSLEPDKYRPWK